MKQGKEKSGKRNIAKELFFAFRSGSVFTRISFLFMGFGQIARGQVGKGLAYLFSQAAFLLYTIFFGGRYIGHLFSGNLGTRLSGEHWNENLQIFEKIQGDNSFLILLYGVASLVILAVFVCRSPALQADSLLFEPSVSDYYSPNLCRGNPKHCVQI